MFEGSTTAKIIFVSDFQRSDEVFERVSLSEARKTYIVNALNRAGVPESDYAFTLIWPTMPKDLNPRNLSDEQRVLGQLACKKLINDSSANVIVPLGEYALNFITGLEDINKQKCSILQVKAEFGAKKAIPLPHPEHIQKVREDQAYLSFGCQRLAKEKESSLLSVPDRKFLLSLDLTFEEILSYLEDKVLSASEIAIDVETGRGQVNTHGFAISPTEAIAVDVSPASYAASKYHKLWSVIAKILESDVPKIAQNAIYESQWASRYGIDLRNVSFDTMWAMKMLHPSLEKGLDNVGRIYTEYPYWKDDHSGWNNVRNWRSHLKYNCCDTTGTFAAKVNMQADLKHRKLDGMFSEYMSKLFPRCQDMSNYGILVNENRLKAVKTDIERDLAEATGKLDALTEHKFGRKINPNSPKQVKEVLKELKIKIPTSKGKETIAKDALIRLRKTHPKEDFLINLIQVNKLSSQLDTYFNFSYDSDNRARFSVDAFHNEFGEWNSGTNPFGSGFSMDDVPKKTREFLVADEGCDLLQLSFHWAEVRYLAFDSGDSRLMDMVSKHYSPFKFIASQMFRKQVDLLHDLSIECRIAEQAIYASAYGTSARAFATECMGRFGFSMSETEARRYMQIVTENFAGLIKRQFRIQDQIKRSRTLTNGLGRTITYYDRLNEDLFKKAYQWGFRSTKADILNHLTAYCENAQILVRNNDILLIQVEDASFAYEIIDKVESMEWHPEIKNIYGSLMLPVRFKIGKTWGGLKDV